MTIYLPIGGYKKGERNVQKRKSLARNKKYLGRIFPSVNLACAWYKNVLNSLNSNGCGRKVRVKETFLKLSLINYLYLNEFFA